MRAQGRFRAWCFGSTSDSDEQDNNEEQKEVGVMKKRLYFCILLSRCRACVLYNERSSASWCQRERGTDRPRVGCNVCHR